jgi:WD40 repeat protein
MPAVSSAPAAAIAAAALPDGRTVLAVVSDSKTVLIWGFHGGVSRHLGQLQLDDHVCSMAIGFTSEGRALVVVGHPMGRLVVRDLDTGGLMASLNTGRQGSIEAIAAGSTSDGRTIVATADDSGTVQFWDLEGRRAIGEPIRHINDKVMLAGVSAVDGVQFVVGTQ